MLPDHNWNLEKAIRAYNLIQTAALPPVGPRKNVLSNAESTTHVNSTALSGGKSLSPNNTLEGLDAFLKYSVYLLEKC